MVPDAHCKSQKRGAYLSLPNGGYHNDAIATKPFKNYIRDHVVSWFNWAQNNKLSVERTEDLVLVTGCTLVTSWAAAVFVDNMEAEICLRSRVLSNAATSFIWSKIRGPVVYRNSRFDLVRSPITFTIHALIYSVWKARFTHDSGSMRLHQRLPSKARPFLRPDQTNGSLIPSCSNPSSSGSGRRP